MAASHFKLNNLYAIIDNNNFQQTGSNKNIMDTQSLKNKWASFGWDTEEVDGHNVDQLYSYFNQNKTSSAPKALIAIVKGKGFHSLKTIMIGITLYLQKTL